MRSANGISPLRTKVLKEQIDAPKACQCHHHKDDPAHNRIHSAEKPTHQIKLEKANKPPIQAADNGQDQSDFIHNNLSLLKYDPAIVWERGGKNIRKVFKKTIFFHKFMLSYKIISKYAKAKEPQKLEIF